MRTYATMLRNRPDFFIHCGDIIYAECPLGAEQKLPDGEIWRNIVTEEKSQVAETLAEFRGNYKYNLLDHNLRAFNAEVPMFAQWDDHEVTNDWWPGMPLRVGDADITALAARGCRAFHEFMPTREFAAERGRIYRRIAYGPLLDVFMLDMRSYRGPNGAGATRAESRRRFPRARAGRLAQARACRLTRDLEGDRRRPADRPGQLRCGGAGRRRRRADASSRSPTCCASSSTRGVRNTVWLTADVHYTAAHYYDPNRAVFQDFEPFWEFMSGPAPCRHRRPGALDNTFGPRAVYTRPAARSRATISRPASGCSSSAMSRSTARPR